MLRPSVDRLGREQISGRNFLLSQLANGSPAAPRLVQCSRKSGCSFLEWVPLNYEASGRHLALRALHTRPTPQTRSLLPCPPLGSKPFVYEAARWQLPTLFAGPFQLRARFPAKVANTGPRFPRKGRFPHSSRLALFQWIQVYGLSCFLSFRANGSPAVLPSPAGFPTFLREEPFFSKSSRGDPGKQSQNVPPPSHSLP